jgi:hypothetical protein
MTFATRIAQPGEQGFDTITVIDAEAARALVDAGFDFAIRYADSITFAELDVLTGVGLGVMLAGLARTHGWSADSGASDGARVSAKALAVRFPPAATLWCDQEDGVPDEVTAIAYATGWWRGATKEGAQDPGLYVGSGSGFQNAAALHRDVPFRRYWRSMSQVPNVAVRGYQLLQLFPPNELVAGIRVDRDVVQSDYHGGLPVLCVAA